MTVGNGWNAIYIAESEVPASKSEKFQPSGSFVRVAAGVSTAHIVSRGRQSIRIVRCIAGVNSLRLGGSTRVGL